jgi:hypothetical protein
MKHLIIPIALLAVALPAASATDEWIPLFNGRNLDGWTPKINHHALGDNYLDTFVVRDGVLRISYDRYSKFADEFAHLIYRQPYSNYRLRLDYRFVGKDTPGGPPWAVRNSGVMIHGQTPGSIGLDQPFPVSVEVQLLNGVANEVRPTGNVCTPGTRVSFDNKLLTDHCRNSTSRTYTDDRWVHVEVEVRGSRHVSHTIDGQVVLAYDKVELDPTDLRGMELYLKNGLRMELDSGYISLQGEGHPIEFRNVELMELRD